MEDNVKAEHESEFLHYDELTQAQKDDAFVYHAATGGDLIFMRGGEVIAT